MGLEVEDAAADVVVDSGQLRTRAQKMRRTGWGFAQKECTDDLMPKY